MEAGRRIVQLYVDIMSDLNQSQTEMHGLEEEQQTRQPVTLEIAGAAPV